MKNGKYCALASEGDTFVYSDDAQEKIVSALQRDIRILPISIPPTVLYENTAQNWCQMYMAGRTSGGVQSHEIGHCIHLGLMRQVPFKFETTSGGLLLMRMIRPGELQELQPFNPPSLPPSFPE
jgi:hypothetical protein